MAEMTNSFAPDLNWSRRAQRILLMMWSVRFASRRTREGVESDSPIALRSRLDAGAPDQAPQVLPIDLGEPGSLADVTASCAQRAGHVFPFESSQQGPAYIRYPRT